MSLEEAKGGCRRTSGDDAWSRTHCLEDGYRNLLRYLWEILGDFWYWEFESLENFRKWIICRSTFSFGLKVFGFNSNRLILKFRRCSFKNFSSRNFLEPEDLPVRDRKRFPEWSNQRLSMSIKSLWDRFLTNSWILGVALKSSKVYRSIRRWWRAFIQCSKKTNSELSLWQSADGLVYDFLILTLLVLVFHHRNEECCWANILCLSEVVY